jgi:hypothetical protein
MAILKKVAVPLLLAAAAVLLLSAPADAAFRLRSLKNNDGDQSQNNNQDQWNDNNNNDDDGWSHNGGGGGNRPRFSAPTITCGTQDEETISVTVCAADGETPRGFRLEWLSEDEFIANDGFGCNKTDESDALCAARVVDKDALDADGCFTFTIGDGEQDDVSYKPADECSDVELTCGTTLVFRAFALGHQGRGRQTSEASEPESCSTEECFVCPEGEECQEVCEPPLVDIGCVEPCPDLSTGRNEAGSCICPSNFIYDVVDNLCVCPGDLEPADPVPATGPVCVCPPGSIPSETCPDTCIPNPDVPLVQCINTNPGQGSLCGACAPNCNSQETADAICELYYGLTPPAGCDVAGIGGGGQNPACPQTFVCCAIKPDDEVRPTNPAMPSTCPVFGAGGK